MSALACSECKNWISCFSKDNPLQKIGDNFKQKEFMSFEKNEYHYKTGETAKGVFCIYDGRVKIYKTDNMNREIIIHNAADREIIGFNSVAKREICQYSNSNTTNFCLFFYIN